MLARRYPFDFGSVFETFLKPFDTVSDIQDFSKNENSYVLRVVSPGFEEKELQVHVNRNVLTVSGKHERKEESKDKHFVMESTSFERSYTLPLDAVTDQITAEYKAGVLVVTIPRSTKTAEERKQIVIKTS